MKKRTSLSMLLLMAFSLLPYVVGAQVSLSIVSTRVNSNLDLSTVTVAGDHVSQVVDATQTLRYKFMDYTRNDYARIDVAITSGTIPSGIQIKMSAPGYSSSSNGYSVSYQTVTLSSNPGTNGGLLLYQIYNIKDSYTFSSLVTMTISVLSDFSLLHPGNNTLNLTYTISSYLY
jgi:hypothetical protein